MRKIVLVSLIVNFFIFPILANAQIKIGALFDITGATGEVGKPYSLGVRDYIKYINKTGGIRGKKVKLIFTDYRYKVEEAKKFYRKLKKEKVVGIIGWGTGDTLALTPLITRDKIPFISASYDHSLGNARRNPYNFLIGVSYSDQMRIILRHIKTTLGRGTKIAILHHPSPFGKSPLPAAKREAKILGLKIVEIIPMIKKLNYKKKLNSLKKKGVKVLIIQNSSVPTYKVIRACEKIKANFRIYGLNWTINENMIRLSGKSLDGFIYAAVNAFWYDNVPGLKEIFNFKKRRRLDSAYIRGWITAKIMCEGLKRIKGEITGENLKKALETLRNFSTGEVTDNITFTPTDHWGAKRLKLYKFSYKHKKFIPITGFTK